MQAFYRPLLPPPHTHKGMMGVKSPGATLPGMSRDHPQPVSSPFDPSPTHDTFAKQLPRGCGEMSSLCGELAKILEGFGRGG